MILRTVLVIYVEVAKFNCCAVRLADADDNRQSCDGHHRQDHKSNRRSEKSA